jgi:predicted 3-demethylubiquinone-9 3-methyltransferase (glyoxalase superfamily)
MQKITPFLWFNREAEEAVNFYTSIFRDSETGVVTRYNKESAEVSGMPEGSVMTIGFRLHGQEFTALNGGPQFRFTEAVSFVVHCEDQDEVDYFWEKLAEGGEENRCGWLKDRYGVSWQVVPAALGNLLGDPDPARSQRVMQAMLKMKKIDIGALRRARDKPEGRTK